MNGVGQRGIDGKSGNGGEGGKGFDAGGGGGGMNTYGDIPRYAEGDGASGLVYVEWD